MSTLLARRCQQLAIAISALLIGVCEAATVDTVRLGVTDQRTRLVLDVDRPANAELSVGDDPTVLQLTLAGTELKEGLNLPAQPVGLLDSVRVDTLSSGDVGLVVRMSDAFPYRLFTLSPNGQYGHRVVLDITPAANAPVIHSIRHGRHEGFSRLVLDMDKLNAGAIPEAMALNTPNTYLLKLPASLSAMALGGARAKRFYDPLLKAVQWLPGKGLEIRTSVPIQFRYHSLPAYPGKKPRWIVDLYPAPEEVAQVESVTKEPLAVTPPTPRQKPSESISPPVSSASSEPRPHRFQDNVSLGGTADLLWSGSEAQHRQQLALIVEPRLDIDFPSAQLVAIARLRFDEAAVLGPWARKPENYSDLSAPLYNGSRAQLALRELYIDMMLGDAAVRIGKQQVVWGQADGIKVLDVVNPQSFREFILEDFDRSRIPLWMVNLEHPLGRYGELQWLLIPDPTTHELAQQGTPFEMSSPLRIPVAPAGLKTVIASPELPDDGWRDGDAGVRYRHFVAGWDISLNYLYHYDDFPVLLQSLQSDASGQLTGYLTPDYRRSHLTGFTASTAFGSFTLRSEFARESERWFLSRNIARGGVLPSPELSAVVGLDWQQGDGLWSMQWFASRVMDDDLSLYRRQTEQMLSLLTQQSFANSTWELRLLGLYSIDYEDTLFQLRLKRWLGSRMELWVGADVFSGDKRGLFGQFAEQDRILLGLRVGF